MRSPAFAAPKARNGGRALSDAVAPVKRIVPFPRGAMRRAASRPTMKPAQGVLAPQALEEFRGRLQRGSGDIAPDVVSDEFDMAAPVRVIQQGGHVGLACGVGDLRKGRAARCRDPLGDGPQPIQRPAGDRDAQPFSRETPRQCCSETRLGTDADHNRHAFMRRLSFVMTHSNLCGRPLCSSEEEDEVVRGHVQDFLQCDVMRVGGFLKVVHIF